MPDTVRLVSLVVKSARRAGVVGNGGDRHRRSGRCRVHHQGAIRIGYRTRGIRIITLPILNSCAIQIEGSDGQVGAVPDRPRPCK